MSDTSRPITLLGLCGSLRASSSNLRILQAAKQLVPANTRLTLFSDLASLPPFNPDMPVADHLPVQAWVDAVRDCDGLLISSPVYARGYPGSLKNALDWLVNTDAFVEKPFALFNASTRSLDVQDSLIRVLETMSGKHLLEATIAINLLGTHLSADDVVADTNMAATLARALSAFKTRLVQTTQEPPP